MTPEEADVAAARRIAARYCTSGGCWDEPPTTHNAADCSLYHSIASALADVEARDSAAGRWEEGYKYGRKSGVAAGYDEGYTAGVEASAKIARANHDFNTMHAIRTLLPEEPRA